MQGYSGIILSNDVAVDLGKGIMKKDNGESKEGKQARSINQQSRLGDAEFVANLSHELRTPLNAIVGFSQLLNQQLSHLPDQQESVQMIEQAGRHLWELIDQLIDLVKIEGGVSPIAMESIDVYQLLKDCIDLIAIVAKDKQIKVFFTPDSEPIYAKADRLRLRQVILNLLSNAVKYNVESGEVHVAASILEGNITISIVDSGIGIEKSLQDKVFQPFQRLGAQFSDIEGTGLGLSISKELIELMAGEIGFTSQEFEGSRFFIKLLPADNELRDKNKIQTIQTLTSFNAPLIKENLKLLYIEDNPTNIRFMRLLLEEFAELELITATTGKEGLAQAKKFHPDIILLDMRLPDMHGLEVLEKLAEDAAHSAKVYAVSADALPAQIELAMHAGIDGYFTKPIDINRLQKLLVA